MLTKNKKAILTVQDLKVYYATPQGDVKATDEVSFELYEGETLGLVGESGSGKTTATSGILNMVSSPGRIAGGSVDLDGVDLLALSEEELRHQRWQALSLIPQGAMNSLNPTMKVSAQILDVIVTHAGKQPRKALKERILALFQQVGLPARIYDMYPHELSGGMKQRVCIAMAIALNPKVIIADEATSALDVVVQRVVAQTLLKVKQSLGVSMIMIGHDMGLMAQMVDRIAVMYSGKLVEIAPVTTMFATPGHPYSQILIESIPSLTERKSLKITEGITHDPRNPPSGCIFRLRCPHANASCQQPQVMREVRPGQQVACHRFEVLNGASSQVVDEVAHG